MVGGARVRVRRSVWIHRGQHCHNSKPRPGRYVGAAEGGRWGERLRRLNCLIITKRRKVPVRRSGRIRRELCGICSGGSVAAHRSA